MPSPSLRPAVQYRKGALVPKAIPPTELSADGAVPIDADRTFLITKGSIAALTVAAPGQANVGRRLTFYGGTDFAHAITFTGSTLRDGTTGGHSLATSPAFEGGGLTVVAVTAAKWSVESNNLFVITT